jgi:hypothetical protein
MTFKAKSSNRRDEEAAAQFNPERRSKLSRTLACDLMQAHSAQVVFCGLEEGAGTVVGQKDRRAVGAEQCP